MIIGIDANEANVEKKVGISEYAFRLIWEFYKNASKHIEFKIYLKNKPRLDMPSENGNWQYCIVKPNRFWTQIGLPIKLFFEKNKPDIFFTTTHYAPRFSPIPTVISVMDLSYIHYPYLFNKKDLYQLKKWTSYSVKSAKKILTISQSSKNDIIKYYRIPDNKVCVIYPGIKMENEKLVKKQDLKKYKIDKKYILYVGTLQPRKNVVRLIEAFAKLVKEGKDINLVIVGKKGWMYEEILAAPNKYKVVNEVKFLDFVPDEDMPDLYRNALCFVLPSLYEGFGLPVLEAMKYGCPVITSNVSSLPEAGGDAALYFNPYKAEEIYERIKEVIENKKIRENMVKKGYDQINKFSWEKAGKEALAVLKEVNNER